MQALYDEQGYVLRAVEEPGKSSVSFETCFKSKNSLAVIEESCVSSFASSSETKLVFDSQQLKQALNSEELSEVYELMSAEAVVVMGTTDPQPSLTSQVVAVTSIGASVGGLVYNLVTARPEGLLVVLVAGGVMLMELSTRKVKASEGKLTEPSQGPKKSDEKAGNQLDPGAFHNLPALKEHSEAVSSTAKGETKKVLSVKEVLYDLALYLGMVDSDSLIDRYCYPKVPRYHENNTKCFKV